MADTVTIPNVELVKAGTWRPGTQPNGLVITPAQIAAAALAAADAEVDAAPIKIGHDARLDAELGDSAPALGWVRNIRVKPGDPNTLVGDLTDIPAKLAAIMPKAFRRRSAELGFDVRTPGGKLYSMALSALSLLGAKPPAVKGLADITSLYGLGEGVTAGERVTVHLAAGVDDGERAAGLADGIAGIDRLGLPADQRDELVAQLEAAAGVTTPTIPDPVKDDGHNGGDRPAHTKEPTTMDDKALRELLGIEADADIEATVKDLLAAKDTKPEPKLDANGQPIPEPKLDANGKPVEDADAGKELVGAGAANLSAAVVKELKDAGLTVLSQDAFTAIADGAKAGASAAAKLAAADAAAALADAVRTGRITPKESEALAPLLFGEGKDVAVGKALLAAMTPGKIATQELGAATGADAVTDPVGTPDQWAAFEADVFDFAAESDTK